MMRAMLEDRFHLRLHAENRPAKVWHLTVGKRGVKVSGDETVTTPEARSPISVAMGNDSGRMIAIAATMEDIARSIAVFLKAPVTDETNLKGHYTFNIKWSGFPSPEGPATVASGLSDEGTNLFLSNIEEQLGLRVSSSAGMSQFWIVDRVEAPTVN